MYQPSEDSFLLAESVKDYEGTLALEIGVGSGEVLKALCLKFQWVIGTDIDFMSLEYCMNMLPSKVALVCCDAASSIRTRFDLIASNPPYLPIENREEPDRKIHGGLKGIETSLHFLESAKELLTENGKVLIVVSSMSDYQGLLDRADQIGLKSRVLRKRKLFFETLIILEISV